jgi:hypothetical protein
LYAGAVEVADNLCTRTALAVKLEQVYRELVAIAVMNCARGKTEPVNMLLSDGKYVMGIRFTPHNRFSQERTHDRKGTFQ